MIVETLVFISPLAFWPLYCLLRSENKPRRRLLRNFSVTYLAFQVLANAYVWYSLLGDTATG